MTNPSLGDCEVDGSGVPQLPPLPLSDSQSNQPRNTTVRTAGLPSGLMVAIWRYRDVGVEEPCSRAREMAACQEDGGAGIIMVGFLGMV